MKRPSMQQRVSGCDHRTTYTHVVMSQQKATNRMCRSLQERNGLGEPRWAMSEVQICGIPKPGAGEVASTA
jgi:hypothetical protein